MRRNQLSSYPFKMRPTYSAFGFAPFHQPNLARPMHKLAVNVLIVFGCAFVIVFASLLAGALAGLPSVPGTIPTVILQTFAVASVHFVVASYCFKLSVPVTGVPNINPVITILDCVVRGRLGVWPCLLFLLAQATAAAAAGAIIYGLLSPAIPPFTLAAIAKTVNFTTSGWVFFLEALAGAIFAFAFLYAHKTIAASLFISNLLVYPFAGATNNNIFRWLAGCVASSTCNSGGNAWVFALGPIAGIVFAYLVDFVVNFP